MFRAIGFAWYERSPVTEERGGYGTSFENRYEKENMLEALYKILGTSDIKYLWYDKIEHRDIDGIIKELNLK